VTFHDEKSICEAATFCSPLDEPGHRYASTYVFTITRTFGYDTYSELASAYRIY
jgi:hypothetical protein